MKPIARTLAALCAATLYHHAQALPATTPGMLDPTFNNGVAFYQTVLAREDFSYALLVQPDGKVLMAGYGEELDTRQDIGYLTRHNPDGSLDTTFATGGTRKFGNPAVGKPVLDMIGAAGGKVLLVGDRIDGIYPDSTYHPWLTRLNADGTTDTTFGNGGEVLPDCAPRAQCWYQKIARQADGKFIVVSGAYDPPYQNSITLLDRYNADGSPDATFGNGGRVALEAAALKGLEPYHLEIDAQGRYVVSGQISGSPDVGILARVNADGAPDTSFGNAGAVRVNLNGLSTDLRRFDIQPDGRIVIAATTYDPKLTGARYLAFVLRYNADGSPDASFGNAGAAALGGGYGNGARLQADGAIVYYGQGVTPGTSRYVPMAARVLPNGQLDASFANAGILITDPNGSLSTLMAMAIGADNRITVAGYSQSGTSSSERHSTLMRLIGTETTTTVTEFYNTALNHYFITADPNEASAIDNGAAGPGWARTGIAWKSGGPARVCRFYGSPEVDPATSQRRGPNGHFYTISAEECALVKEDAGWKFESYDFSGWPKQADGTCAAGTVAVKRAYNNRFAVNDSNHRYTTSDAVYAEMVAAGWSGEGTVFCAPQ